MKFIFTFSFLLVSILLQAQDFNESSSIFISGGMGINNSSSSEETRLNSFPQVLFFGSLGIPITNKLFLYNRISYSLKSDFTAFEIGPMNELVQTTASFSQLIYNSGLRYKVYSNNSWAFAVSTGFTYSLVNQENVISGESFNNFENQSLFGYFGGVDLEYKIPDSKITMFGEAQYNHIGADNINYRDKFSGTNFTIGLRYYFQK